MGVHWRNIISITALRKDILSLNVPPQQPASDHSGNPKPAKTLVIRLHQLA